MPDFVLPSASGIDVRLSDQARTHSAVVILFYRGIGCAPCRDQIAELAAAYARLRQEGAEVLAISTDSQADARRMADRVGANFPVLYDDGGIVTSIYNLTEQLASDLTTFTIILDRNMRIVGTAETTGAQVLPAEAVLDAIRELNGSDTTSS